MKPKASDMGERMAKARLLSPQLSGVAAEYFVAAELSKRGWIASLTLRNAKGIDILASHPQTLRQVSIQVKARQVRTRPDPMMRWVLSRAAEETRDARFFYVFVALRGEKERPDFVVVPSEVVAEHTHSRHRRWMASTRRDGAPHKDSDMRSFSDVTGEYFEAWDLLEV